MVVNRPNQQHFLNMHQVGAVLRLCGPPGAEQDVQQDALKVSRMLCADCRSRRSPVLLAGSSAVRHPVAHHPQVAVLQHDALTLPEGLPLIWERMWHYGLLMRKAVQEI